MRFRILIFTVFMIVDAHVYASDYVTSIEDPALARLPTEVGEAFTAQVDQTKLPLDEDESTCDFKGIKLATGDEELPEIYFVTTAHACGWGASLGPIWIVDAAVPYGVLLQTRSHSLHFEEGKDGLNILFQTGTVGLSTLQYWKKIHGEFVNSESKHFDSKSCETSDKNHPRNPFICE